MPLSFTSIDWILNWVQEPTWKLVALIFVNILWVPLFWWFLKEFWESWQFWVVGLNRELNFRWIFLAVDAPRDAEQTPVSMEAIFNQLAGAHGAESWWETNWDGDGPDWFSFEIVSIEGYVQYVIRCLDKRRDLVEAAIYAQYPDAEITEVNDYVGGVPDTWPQEDWKMMATEYTFDKEDVYPIKTYPEFEDKIRGEFVDPMASMLEIMSKIGKGEQLWFQLIAYPIIEPDWVPKAQKTIDAFVEKKAEVGKKGIIDYITAIPTFLVGLVEAAINPDAIEGGGDAKDDRSPRTNVLSLTPGEKDLLEKMEKKIGKIAYKCRIRIVYIGKKSVFNKAGPYSAIVGAIKQFNDGTRNWFTVTKKSWTKTNYSFKKARLYQRMQRFYNAYKARSGYAGAVPQKFIMNVEEMATIYHFPMASVKAPLVKRTGAKKSEPPPSLPVEDSDFSSTITIPARKEPPSLPQEDDNAFVEPSSEAVVTPSFEDQVQFIEIPEAPPKPVESFSDEGVSPGGEAKEDPSDANPPPNLPIG